jgi:endonuclease-3
VYGFGKPAIPVDTHVHRISNRIGLIGTRTPADTERELWKIIPEEFILLVNDLMVKHGQTVCRPVKPQCAACPVAALCDHATKGSIPNASS